MADPDRGESEGDEDESLFGEDELGEEGASGDDDLPDEEAAGTEAPALPPPSPAHPAGLPPSSTVDRIVADLASVVEDARIATGKLEHAITEAQKLQPRDKETSSCKLK